MQINTPLYESHKQRAVETLLQIAQKLSGPREGPAGSKARPLSSGGTLVRPVCVLLPQLLPGSMFLVDFHRSLRIADRFPLSSKYGRSQGYSSFELEVRDFLRESIGCWGQCASTSIAKAAKCQRGCHHRPQPDYSTFHRPQQIRKVPVSGRTSNMQVAQKAHQVSLSP